MSTEVDIGNAVKNASEVIDKTLSFDAEIGDTKVKYSAWIATLATAGFGLTLWNYDKILQHSWLLHHPRVLNAIFISTSGVFLLSIACSAGALAVSNKLSASFKQQRTLISRRGFIMMNHLEAFKADAEVRLVMQGVPTAFIADRLFEDLVASEGGAMDYEFPTDTQLTDDYKQSQIGHEFALLTKLLKPIANSLTELQNARLRDAGRLSWLILIQQLLVGWGYGCLLLLASP